LAIYFEASFTINCKSCIVKKSDWKKNPNKHRNKGKREIKMKRKKIKTGKKRKKKGDVDRRVERKGNQMIQCTSKTMNERVYVHNTTRVISHSIDP
jgi:hypothetical protein